MTLDMIIRMEREDAKIEQLIETAREFDRPDDETILYLKEKFDLSEEEAFDRLKEYDSSSDNNDNS